jgi:cation transport protein ChaC
MTELWVFGYGSLMWRPDFPYAEKLRAELRGAHRALCVRSVVHRGTRQAPGLVLGLDLGGMCEGVAFRIAPGHEEATRKRLKAREQVTFIYREAQRAIRLEDGRAETALCFMVDRTHPQYAGRLSAREQARITSTARGGSGANRDYVLSTARHLQALGIRDEAMETVRRLLERRSSFRRRDAGLPAR